MRSDVARVIAVAAEIDRVDRPNDLLDCLQDVLAPFGVATLSVNLIQRPGSDIRPRSLLDRGWSRWSDVYGRRGHARNDPAVHMLIHQTRPFTWAEALAARDTPAARHVMEDCWTVTGSREGFVVPVRETDGALLTAAFSGESLDLSAEARPALHLAGYYFATRGRELVDGIGLAGPCPLTERQRECLRWVMAGKSDFEIAMIIGRSPRTVHNHVEAAKTILGVGKRNVAAFDAWRRGWLH